MAKITKHDGPTIETPADRLRSLGKLGPYESIEVPPDGTEAEIEGDGTGESLPPIEDEETDAADQDDVDTLEDESIDPEDSAGDGGPQRPAVNAPKADWVAYVEAVTGTEVDESTWTKAQLIDEFGAD